VAVILALYVCAGRRAVATIGVLGGRCAEGATMPRLQELKPPKAGSRRAVPISDELVKLLLEVKMAAPDKTGPVFASLNGGRLAHRNVERRGFDAAATDAGLEEVTFHDLRHAYGSRLASKGLTARAIADAMGHKRTATTEIYIQRFNGDQADDKVREAMTG
jgi:integrase